MRLTAAEARSVVWEEHKDWKPVTSPKMEAHDRWTIGYSCVFKYNPTGKLYKFCYQRGATERQEERPFEYDEYYDPVEVEEVEEVVKVYRPVK